MAAALAGLCPAQRLESQRQSCNLSAAQKGLLQTPTMPQPALLERQNTLSKPMAVKGGAYGIPA